MRNKYFIKIFSFLFLAVIYSLLDNAKIYAQSIDLTNFIAQPNFPEHTLSTGEVVSYTSEGIADKNPGNAGVAARQYKNGNYEQFFIKSDGIYRREDTSWAPFNGQQAICENGNKAVYTLDSSNTCVGAGATPLTDGARWLPITVTNGQSYNQQTHNILSIDSQNTGPSDGPYSLNRTSDLKVCNLKSPQTGYPACRQTPSLTITGYFAPGEYTFCTGATNPAPVVTISGTAGPGSGDGFAYMEGCGLAGFSDANMKVGITSGCGVQVTNSSNWTCSNTFTAPVTQDQFVCGAPSNEQDLKTITVYGKVRQATWTEVPNPDPTKQPLIKTGLPFRNAVITNYSGDPCTLSNLGARENAGRLVNIDFKRNPHTSTDNFGDYTLPVTMTSFVKERFIAFSCNGQVRDLYKCDLRKDTDGEIRLDVDLNCLGEYVDKVPDPSSPNQTRNVRPHLYLTPRSPGENVAFTSSEFTMCVDSTFTKRDKTRDFFITEYKNSDDTDEKKKHWLRKADHEETFIDAGTCPYVPCEDFHLTAGSGFACAGYTRCMPKESEVVEDEFSAFNSITTFGKNQLEATSIISNLACGPLLQQTTLRWESSQDKPAPTSKNGTGRHLLPTIEYIAAMNRHITNVGGAMSTWPTDVLGPLNVNSHSAGIVQKFVTTPNTIKQQIKFLDPSMPFAYDNDGNEVILGQVEVPGYKDQTLCEILGVTCPNSRRFEEIYFPSSCIREMANATRTMAPHRFSAHNTLDTPITVLGEGTCDDAMDCSRRYGIGTQQVSGPNVNADATGDRSYVETTSPVRNSYQLANLDAVLVNGGPDSTRSDSADTPQPTGMVSMFAYPGDPRTRIQKSEIDSFDSVDWQKVEKYENTSDNECIKIGAPIISFCMCPQAQYAGSAGCPNPLNRVNIPNEGDDIVMLSALNSQYIAGSNYLSVPNAPDAFYESPHEPWGGIYSFITNFINLFGRLWAIFGGHKDNAGGVCIQYEWSGLLQGICPASGTMRCTPAGASQEMDCECRTECYTGPNNDIPCTADEAATCRYDSPTAISVNCDYRVRNGAPEFYGANGHPDCKGDTQAEMGVVAEGHRSDYSAFYMLLDSWDYPGEKRDSCAEGGTISTLQANYELYDKTGENFTTKVDTGQTGSCKSEKLFNISEYAPSFGRNSGWLSGEPVIGSGGSGGTNNPL